MTCYDITEAPGHSTFSESFSFSSLAALEYSKNVTSCWLISAHETPNITPLTQFPGHFCHLLLSQVCPSANLVSFQVLGSLKLSASTYFQTNFSKIQLSPWDTDLLVLGSQNGKCP